MEEAVCDNGVDEAVDSAMWPASDITAVGGVGDVTSATGTGDMTTGFGDSMGPQGDVTATAAANVDKPTTVSGVVDEAEGVKRWNRDNKFWRDRNHRHR